MKKLILMERPFKSRIVLISLELEDKLLMTAEMFQSEVNQIGCDHRNAADSFQIQRLKLCGTHKQVPGFKYEI